MRKHAPLIFWGTLVALPAMNMTTAFFKYKSVKLQYEIEMLRQASRQLR
jgi:hypothetical protein